MDVAGEGVACGDEAVVHLPRSRQCSSDAQLRWGSAAAAMMFPCNP